MNPINVLPNWMLKYWPLLGAVGWMVFHWHSALPICCPPNGHDYWELAGEIFGVLFAGYAVPRPNMFSGIMNTLTMQPQEPVIPENVKKVAAIAEKAICSAETKAVDNVSKKSSAVEQVLSAAADAGIPMENSEAHLAVELALTKSKS